LSNCSIALRCKLAEELIPAGKMQTSWQVKERRSETARVTAGDGSYDLHHGRRRAAAAGLHRFDWARVMVGIQRLYVGGRHNLKWLRHGDRGKVVADRLRFHGEGNLV
jgi:hypothetical protein